MKKITLIAITFMTFSVASAQISEGIISDFEDGTTQGWSNGETSPNPPVNIPTGGPSGTDDNFIEEESAGGSGPGSRLVMFNENSEWLGDYSQIGPAEMVMNIKNAGNEELFIRIGLAGGPDETEMVTSDPISVPVSQTDWTLIGIPVDEFSFTVTDGDDTPAQVLQDVIEIRILSNEDVDFRGAAIVGKMHIDNIGIFGAIGFDDNLIETFSISPNPALNRLNISSQVQMQEYSIYSLLGATVAQGLIDANEKQINISDLSSGPYIIEVSSEKSTTTKKFIKR